MHHAVASRGSIEAGDHLCRAYQGLANHALRRLNESRSLVSHTAH
jgi:hypothetical protein